MSDETEATPAAGSPDVGLHLATEKAEFRIDNIGQVKRLPGFRKGSSVPKNVSPRNDAFIRGMADQDELNEILVAAQKRARRILGKKARHFELVTADGNGSAALFCPEFKFYVDVEQNPDDAAGYRRRMILQLLVAPSSLPDDFDDIFEGAFDVLSIPLGDAPDFDDVLDSIEDWAEEAGVDYDDNAAEKWVSLQLEGVRLIIDINANEVRVESVGAHGPLSLLEQVRLPLGALAQGNTRLLS